MNWIKENKFLTGLLVVTILGVGILGYLLWDAWGKADEANGRFTALSDELKRLQALPTYPNEKNLGKLNEQKSEHQQRIDQLQAKLASMDVPGEALGPVPFQDRLRSSVSEFQKKAQQAGMKLPEKFYMGMARYQSTPPRPEASSILARELKAIEFLMDALLEAHVGELTDSVDREEFPEENGSAPAKTPAKPTMGKPGSGPAPAEDLVKRHAIGISVLTDQLPLQKFLDAVASSKAHFLVLRTVTVLNEKITGPARDAAPAPAAAPAAAETPAPTPTPADASATPAATPAPVGINYIVGQEKVKATMVIELTDFANPKH